MSAVPSGELSSIIRMSNGIGREEMALIMRFNILFLLICGDNYNVRHIVNKYYTKIATFSVDSI